MKTLLIAHNFIKKSVSSMSFFLAHDFAEKGNRVIFISHKPYFEKKQVIKVGKGEIIVMSWSSEKRPVSFKDFLWFFNIYREYKPNIIIGHFVGSNISTIVGKILSLGKAKTIVYYHTLTSAIQIDSNKSMLLQRILRYRKRFFYYFFCDIIVCPSQMGKNDLKKNFSVIGSVVLNPMEDRFTVKAIIPTGKIVISYLGRLDYTKGVIDMIEAFSLYQRKNPNSRIILNIAGNGVLESQVIDKINNLNMIKYIGGLTYEKVDAYLNASHFTIIPSKFDNLPTVGIESLMNKTPLLISNTTGLTEYLVDGEECFKFDATQEGIFDVFSKVEDGMKNYIKMQEKARETYLMKFTNQNYFDNISKIIS